MIIPSSVIQTTRNPLENQYFVKANQTLSQIQKTTKETYYDDLISIAINTLERFYKGFLQAASDFDKDYTLPHPKFLTRDHDLLGMVVEIKENYPNVLPRYSKSDWHDFKNLLRDFRSYYTSARYTKDFTFEDFTQIVNFVQQQAELLQTYIKEKGFEEYQKSNDFPLDM